jgi:polyhydroxyalkanoate synthesis regulator phasin
MDRATARAMRLGVYKTQIALAISAIENELEREQRSPCDSLRSAIDHFTKGLTDLEASLERARA